MSCIHLILHAKQRIIATRTKEKSIIQALMVRLHKQFLHNKLESFSTTKPFVSCSGIKAMKALPSMSYKDRGIHSTVIYCQCVRNYKPSTKLRRL